MKITFRESNIVFLAIFNDAELMVLKQRIEEGLADHLATSIRIKLQLELGAVNDEIAYRREKETQDLKWAKFYKDKEAREMGDQQRRYNANGVD